jgi:membrane-bound metal-dependent hydrolase YbcI (DUF457 family)
VLLWFVGPSILIVWAVFGSPAADYRLVALGSLLPLIELPIGSPRLFHSLTGAALVLAAVMIGARGQRLVQRRLLAVPIGMLLHLVLDGAWADTEAFWWPFLGTSWSTADLPELGRGPAFTIVLEVIGLAACVWGYRRFRLDEPDRRTLFLQTGRVGRDITPPR